MINITVMYNMYNFVYTILPSLGDFSTSADLVFVTRKCYSLILSMAIPQICPVWRKNGLRACWFILRKHNIMGF